MARVALFVTALTIETREVLRRHQTVILLTNSLCE